MLLADIQISNFVFSVVPIEEGKIQKFLNLNPVFEISDMVSDRCI